LFLPDHFLFFDFVKHSFVFSTPLTPFHRFKAKF